VSRHLAFLPFLLLAPRDGEVGRFLLFFSGLTRRGTRDRYYTLFFLFFSLQLFSLRALGGGRLFLFFLLSHDEKKGRLLPPFFFFSLFLFCPVFEIWNGWGAFLSSSPSDFVLRSVRRPGFPFFPSFPLRDLFDEAKNNSRMTSFFFPLLEFLRRIDELSPFPPVSFSFPPEDDIYG